MEPLCLPNLEERTLARFDELARKEKIFYEEAVSELITFNGFNVSQLLDSPTSIALMQILIKRHNVHATLEPLGVKKKYANITPNKDQVADQ